MLKRRSRNGLDPFCTFPVFGAHSKTAVPAGAVFGEQTTSHGASRSFPIDRSLESFNDRDLKGLILMGKTELRYGPRANHAEVTIVPLGDSR
jgi:hypothetical protein